MIRKLILLLAGLALSCSSQSQIGKRAPRPPTNDAGYAQLVMYAQLDTGQIANFVWDIRKIALNRRDGSQVGIPDHRLKIKASEYDDCQKLLVVTDFRAGQYDGLTIFTREIADETSLKPYSTKSSVLSIDHPMNVIAGTARTLILHISIIGDSEIPGLVQPSVVIEDENPLPSGELIYVANERSSNVSVIDKRLGRVVYNIFVGSTPYALGTDHRRNRLYIADRKESVIYELDMNSQHLIKATQLDYVDEPVHIEPVPTKDLIIVVNYGTDTIYLVDSFTLQVSWVLEVGDGPVDAVYSAANDIAFILNKHFGTLSVVDLGLAEPAIDTTLSVETQPVSMAVDDNKGWLYITNSGSTDLTVINIEKLGIEKTVTIGMGAGDIVFDPFGRRLYVSMTTTNEVLCVDPYTGIVVYSVSLGSKPGKLLFDSEDKRLYVVLPTRDTIAVIDPMKRQVVNWIETGYSPQSLAARL